MSDSTNDAATVDSTGDQSVADATPDEPTDAPEIPTGADEKPTNEQGRSRRDERYRQRLRETEAQRDNLLQRVEHMQRNEVQRLTADRLADPADLWRDTELADLLDDDGNIDTTKVDGRVRDLLEEHPHWATPSPKMVNRNALKSGASAPEGPRKDPWVSAFSPGGGSRLKRD